MFNNIKNHFSLSASRSLLGTSAHGIPAADIFVLSAYEIENQHVPDIRPYRCDTFKHLFHPAFIYKINKKISIPTAL